MLNKICSSIIGFSGMNRCRKHYLPGRSQGTMRLDLGLAFLSGLIQDYLLPALTNTLDQEYLQFLKGPRAEAPPPGNVKHLASTTRPPERCLPPSGIFQRTCGPNLFSSLSGNDSEGVQSRVPQTVSVCGGRCCPILRQSPNGFQTLIRVAGQINTIDLTEVLTRIK